MKFSAIMNMNVKMNKWFAVTLLGWMLPTAIQAQSTNVMELPPLDELGTGTFMGKMGGLYPEGSNIMPAPFFIDAVERAQAVMPLDQSGNASANGKIGVVAIGASTVAMFGKALGDMIYEVPGIQAEIVYVNGGIGGQDLNKIYDPMARYWLEVDKRVKEAGLTNEQVQVAWMQEDDLRNSTASFDQRPRMLADEFAYAARQLKIRYPNLQLLYFTGRHTTDYMPADAKVKHKEPRAYLNGWATKILIEDQINGDPELAYSGPDAKAPLMLWGPYFWTQGEKPRSDGYTFTRDLVNNDGVHPNASGERKVAKDILDFWQTDLVSSIWLTGGEAVAIDPVEQQWWTLLLGTEKLVSVNRKELTGDVRVLLLTREEVMFQTISRSGEDKVWLPALGAGIYTWLVLDEGKFTDRGEFEVDANGELIQETAETDKPEKDVQTDEPYRSKNDVGPDEPAWFINGNNKLPKLVRILGGDIWAKAVFTTADGDLLLEVEDVLHKHTRVNDLMAPGEYVLRFYGKDGELLETTRVIPEFIRIK